MEYLKRSTRTVTGILVAALVICTGLIMGLIYYVAGLTEPIDSLWGVGKPQFWAATIITRWLFTALWGFGDYYLITWLHKKDWFWFKEPEPETSWERERRLKREASTDKSGEILLCVILLAGLGFFGFFFAELAIRVPFAILPPYLPPPN